jgi:hypothetical protein
MKQNVRAPGHSLAQRGPEEASERLPAEQGGGGIANCWERMKSGLVMLEHHSRTSKMGSQP